MASLFACTRLLTLLWLCALPQLRPCGTVIVYGILAGWEITVPMGPLFKVGANSPGSHLPVTGRARMLHHCMAPDVDVWRCRLALEDFLISV